MTASEILALLPTLGSESIKKVLLKHDIKEPLYGVKVEELKKIAKKVKHGYEISLQLYDSGIYDAMYLAGLIAEPAKMTEAQLQHWAEKANCPALREYTVAWVAAEGPHAMKMAKKWVASSDADIASTGWATMISILSITEDAALDIDLLTKLLQQVEQSIHQCPNRVKATMNGYVIALGSFVAPMSSIARQAAVRIGKVAVDVGDTACKIPFAPEYIDKVAAKNAIGKKKKSARCL